MISVLWTIPIIIWANLLMGWYLIQLVGFFKGYRENDIKTVTDVLAHPYRSVYGYFNFAIQSPFELRALVLYTLVYTVSGFIGSLSIYVSLVHLSEEFSVWSMALMVIVVLSFIFCVLGWVFIPLKQGDQAEETNSGSSIEREK